MRTLLSRVYYKYLYGNNKHIGMSRDSQGKLPGKLVYF